MKRTLIAALLLITTTTAFGARGPRMNPGRIADVLALTDAQRTQARALHESQRNVIEPLRNQMRVNRDAIKAAVDAGNAQQAGQLLIGGKAIRDQIKAAHHDFQTKFEALLTAEQKAKWNTMKELRDTRRNHARH